MNEAIGATLPFAFAIAVSPVPIIAIILLLMNEKAKALSIVFAITWFIGVFVIAGLFSVLGGLISGQEDGQSKPILAALKVLLGLCLAYLAVKKWQSRPRGDEEGSLPKWMESLTTLTIGRAIGIAALLVSVNPKNLILEMAAGIQLGQLSLAPHEQVWALVVFALVASASVVGPVLYFLVAPRSAGVALLSMRAWLTRNNSTVMMVLFAVFAVKLIGDGISLF